MVNNVRNLLVQGRPVINGWLTIPNAFAAELMAQAGWDSLTVDLQHGVQDYASMVACFQAIAGRGVAPLVRVLANDAAMIGKVLDAGAAGVICPMVNTAQEAQQVVSACRYPPLGSRSFGPLRFGLYADQSVDILAAGNTYALCIPQIETREALDNLSEILAVPGVDGVYVGPNDLAISLGYAPGSDREDPAMLEIFDHILAQSRQLNRFVAMHCDSPGYAANMLARGFPFVTVGMDAFFLIRAARAAVEETRLQLTT